MFFTFALISMLGYSVHNILIAKFARQMDGLSLSIYRNISLAVVMLPVLLFVSPNEFQALPKVLPYLLYSGITGTISIIFQYESYKYLPVGIVSALIKIRVVLVMLWAYLFLGETIPLPALVMVGIILSASLFLGSQKHHMPHLDKRTEKGILFTILNGFFVSLAIFFMSAASRQTNPLMAGYLWEAFIGIFALIAGILRMLIIKTKISKISIKNLKKIAAISTLAAIGTGTFALAVQYGPIGIVSAIAAAGTIFVSASSFFYHHEKLNYKQWIGIGTVVMGIIGLKLLA